MNNNGVNENQNLNSTNSIDATGSNVTQGQTGNEFVTEPRIIRSFTMSEDGYPIGSTYDSQAASSVNISIVTPEGVPLSEVPNTGEVQLEAMPNIPPEPDKPKDIKVGALVQLKKKKKKEIERAKAQEDLEKGKISYKAMIFPMVVIAVLIFVVVYLVLSNKRELEEFKYEYTPINSSKSEVALDVNSTIVKDLYNKVRTNIREDLAQPEWNDQMRIYLAYRQVVDNDKYDSNCNLFKPNRMEPYTCQISTNFVPKAFTVDTLRHEWKVLFGEDTEMPLINIKLENSCMGGYQYIPERKEYVQGYCDYQAATSFKVSKKLVEATTIRNTIILKEEVKYYENEKMHLPDYLKSGDYYYTFKMDMNYNYVLVSKKYNSKY